MQKIVLYNFFAFFILKYLIIRMQRWRFAFLQEHSSNTTFFQTKIRNLMDLELLNSLMVVRLNGPPTTLFNPNTYVQQYIEEYGRCEVNSPGQKRQTFDDKQEDEEDTEKDLKLLIGKSVLF